MLAHLKSVPGLSLETDTGVPIQNSRLTYPKYTILKWLQVVQMIRAKNTKKSMCPLSLVTVTNIQNSEFRIHAWPPPKMHSYKWDIAAYWLHAVQMYECWPHDWCGAINFAVHNQKWRKYPLFRFVWPSPFALTASCHIHYNMCDGWVEANADICHHRSKLKSAPL